MFIGEKLGFKKGDKLDWSNGTNKIDGKPEFVYETSDKDSILLRSLKDNHLILRPVNAFENLKVWEEVIPVIANKAK